MTGMEKQYIERGELVKELNLVANEYLADGSVQCDIAAGTVVDIRDNIVMKLPTPRMVEAPFGNLGEVSDGYHTFNELYHHRAILFSVICNMFPEKAWKSKRHDTGDMFPGMFIVGIETPEGQATYHYDVDPYWDIFNIKELENAPKWDGHTPDDAIKRIASLSKTQANSSWVFEGKPIHCKKCGYEPTYSLNKDNSSHCPNCGSYMRS